MSRMKEGKQSPEVFYKGVDTQATYFHHNVSSQQVFGS